MNGRQFSTSEANEQIAYLMVRCAKAMGAGMAALHPSNRLATP